ncbi:MAG: hypothetical protein KGQ59_11785, partial [Bdellovibrionales bacterium]|nr:hypothetical protein [Bdellovibrionales bacterium]
LAPKRLTVYSLCISTLFGFSILVNKSIAAPASSPRTPKKALSKKIKKAPLPMPERLPSGGRLRIQTPFSFSSWDWNHVGERIPPELLRAIHRGLYRVSKNGKLQSDLVESETASMDGQSWTFRIRSGIRWSDGQLLTAEHVATGLLRAAEPTAIHPPDAVRLIDGFEEFHTATANTLTGVSVESSSIIKIRLKTPDPLYSYKLTDPRTLPARGDLATKFADYGINVEHMAFLGPWQVTVSHSNLKAKFSPNPYSLETGIRQSFKEIELWYAASTGSISSLFDRNHIDVAFGPIKPIHSPGVQSLSESSLITLRASLGFTRTCSSQCLRSLSKAINRNGIEQIQPTEFWIPPELWRAQDFAAEPKLKAIDDRTLTIPRQIKTLRIGIPTSLDLEPDEFEQLRSTAKKITLDLSKKFLISSKISLIESRNDSDVDLFLELHKAYSLALDSFLAQVEGPQSVAFWKQWSQISPNSDSRLSQLLDHSQSALIESNQVIPLGYRIRYYRKKPYLGELPF